jgi:hypothetical protein
MIQLVVSMTKQVEISRWTVRALLAILFSVAKRRRRKKEKNNAYDTRRISVRPLVIHIA